MTKTRLTAEVANLMAKEVSRERKAQEAELRRYKEGALSVLVECAKTAMDAGERYGVNDKDRKFMRFLCDFLISKGFTIYTDVNPPYWPEKQAQRSIEEIDEEIARLSQSTNAELMSVCSEIEAFGVSHPEFIEVYPWLIDAYDRDVCSSIRVNPGQEIFPPWILQLAEDAGFLTSSNPTFQWERDLQSQLRRIKKKISDHNQELEFLNNENEPLDTSLDCLDLKEVDSVDYFEINQESPLILDWSYNTSTMASIDYSDDAFFDENTLAWLSSSDGQHFLEYAEYAIRIGIKAGKKSSEFSIVADRSKGFNWIINSPHAEGQTICPDPPIIKNLFEINGYTVKFHSPNIKGDGEPATVRCTQHKMEVCW